MTERTPQEIILGDYLKPFENYKKSVESNPYPESTPQMDIIARAYFNGWIDGRTQDDVKLRCD